MNVDLFPRICSHCVHLCSLRIKSETFFYTTVIIMTVTCNDDNEEIFRIGIIAKCFRTVQQLTEAREARLRYDLEFPDRWIVQEQVTWMIKSETYYPTTVTYNTCTIKIWTRILNKFSDQLQAENGCPRFRNVGYPHHH